MVCGGREKYPRTVSRKAKEISGRDFNSFKFLPSMVADRNGSLAVCSKGDVYVFGGYKENDEMINAECLEYLA